MREILGKEKDYFKKWKAKLLVVKCDLLTAKNIPFMNYQLKSSSWCHTMFFKLSSLTMV